VIWACFVSTNHQLAEPIGDWLIQNKPKSQMAEILEADNSRKNNDFVCYEKININGVRSH